MQFVRSARKSYEKGGVRVFLGEYRYSLDAKLRVFIPVPFREELGNEFILCKGLDRSIRLYPLGSWSKFVEKLCDLPDAEAQEIKLFFFASARQVSLDTQGRLLISQIYREHAGIEHDVCVLGNNNRAEIWAAEAWDSFKDSKSIKEQMIKLGV